jgi:hypothetical protein
MPVTTAVGWCNHLPCCPPTAAVVVVVAAAAAAATAVMLLLLHLGALQLNAEFEAACQLHDCPLLPVVRGQFLQGNYIFQLTEDVGVSLEKLHVNEDWCSLSWRGQAIEIEWMVADALLGLLCNVNRVCVC